MFIILCQLAQNLEYYNIFGLQITFLLNFYSDLESNQIEHLIPEELMISTEQL